MKAQIKVWKEIEIKWISVEVPVRYEEEDIPNDFPGRTGDVWFAKIDIDKGLIEGWPAQHPGGKLHMKVCDEGIYKLIDPENNVVAAIVQDYVPHGIIPGEYGDYIILDIGSMGIIRNWKRRPDVSRFFGKEEEE